MWILLIYFIDVFLQVMKKNLHLATWTHDLFLSLNESLHARDGSA